MQMPYVNANAKCAMHLNGQSLARAWPELGQSLASCAIDLLERRGSMLGMTFSIEPNSGDEGLHTEFACLAHDMCRTSSPTTRTSRTAA